MRALLFVAVVLFCGISRAETIHFNEDELSQESVLPLFDQPEAVKRKLVPFSQRFEFGGFLGAALNDPFFNVFPLGAEAYYHFNEFHAFGVVGAYHVSQQSQYVSQIRSQVNGGALIPFNSSPVLKYFVFGEYEFTPFYGKISLTKQAVMNLTISATLGGGLVALTSDLGNETTYGVSTGLNQRLFFTRNLGLKADLKAFFYEQRDIVPVAPSKKLFTNLMVTLGLVYLIPSL